MFIAFGICLIIGWPLAKLITRKWNWNIRVAWLVSAILVYLAWIVVTIWLGEIYPACKI